MKADSQLNPNLSDLTAGPLPGDADFTWSNGSLRHVLLGGTPVAFSRI